MTTNRPQIITDLRIPLASGGHCLFAREHVRSCSALAPCSSAPVVMIVVHGGPGLTDYTESYAGLQRLGDCCHAIVFYDQLGYGASDKPAAFDYELSHYVDELDQVVDFVKNRHLHRPIYVLGHSWGGQIVLEYCCRDQPSSIAGAIVSNTPLDQATYRMNRNKEIYEPY
mmetsp:Transcript_1704/g.3705  ORF Transcript_1704/g.3705 Transcript_1704/m.3705 type:complete len:170 (+) Transcript_1704:112-621(+)